MEKIARELQHPVDRFTKALVVSNIEVLLNYCMRFYERQFVTREELNHASNSCSTNTSTRVPPRGWESPR